MRGALTMLQAAFIAGVCLTRRDLIELSELARARLGAGIAESTVEAAARSGL